MPTIPKEIKNENKLIELAKDASECKVIRIGDTVKIKLRTNKYLYTYKTNPESADNILKRISCPISEL